MPSATTISYISDGIIKQFTIPFTYLIPEYVKVYLNGTITSSFTFTTGNGIQFPSAPALGVVVTITRETSTVPLVVYQDASNLTADDLNTTTEQPLHLLEEVAYSTQDFAVAVSQAQAAASSATSAATIAMGTATSQLYASSYSTLALADAAAVATGKLLVISTQWDTVPATLNAPLLILPGGKLNNVGAVLISGAFSAGAYRVFIGAGVISFGIGAVRQVSPQWWGAVGDGTTDCTNAIQSAINASAAISVKALFQAGTYLVTGQITLPNNTQMSGTHGHMSFWGGTRISFQPTTAQKLFVPVNTGSFVDGYHIKDFYIQGNSTNSTGNSTTAIDCVKITKSRFTNLRIQGFRTGNRCEATINNRFEFCHITDNWLHNIFYTGAYATTDVWEQCYISNAPIGVQTDGITLGIRFNNCIFESITTWGVNIVKECYGWSFTNCYSEDTPNANVATNAMFRVGFDGAVLAETPQLTIMGGHYGGHNGASYGAFLNVDYTDGITLGGFTVSRYVNVVRTSANTQTNQIVAEGWVQASISTTVSDTTKVVGHYPNMSFNGGTRNHQNAFYNSLGFPNSGATPLNDYREYVAASSACTGAITVAVSWKATKVGNHVTLTLPSTVGMATATAYFEYGVVLPAGYCPTATMCFPCAVKSGDTNMSVPGMIFITSGGVIRVYKDLTAAAAFSAGSNAGLGQSGGVSVSWSI
jgi:hypothetical protein